jgi:catechol 2,3-dioxygenase-like lactoylglutathione lyase family enzyme
MPTGTRNTTVPGCGFHHISIMTQNLEESLRFYRDVLGMPVRLEFQVAGRPFALLDMGDGSYIELQAPKPDTAEQAAGNPLVHFALAARDVRASIEKVRQAGYPVTVEPKDVQLNTLAASVAFFTGPSGESVELFQEN